jgi:hypothetical protein
MSLMQTPPETGATVVPITMPIARSELPALFVLAVLTAIPLYGCNFDAEPDYQVKATVFPGTADSDSNDENKNNPSLPATDR